AGVGLLIDGIWRAEKERLHSELGGEEPLGDVDLFLESPRRDFADVGMRERVIADLVTFVVDALHQAGIVLGRNAYEEEGRGCVLALEYIEDLRRVVWIGAVVEGDCDLLLLVSIGFELIRLGQLGETLIRHESRIGIDDNRSLARRGTLHDAQDLALSFDRDIRTRRNFGKFR